MQNIGDELNSTSNQNENINASEVNIDNIPKKQNVILLVILSILIFIFPNIWLINLTDKLNNLKTKSKFKKIFPIISLISSIIIPLIIISLFLYININQENFQGISSIEEIPLIVSISFISIIILSLIFMLSFLISIFKVRKILNEALINKEVNVKLSFFLTLIFHVFYLQYEINRIIEDKEKEKRKAPWVVFGIIVFVFLLTISLLYYMFSIIINELSKL